MILFSVFVDGFRWSRVELGRVSALEVVGGLAGETYDRG